MDRRLRCSIPLILCACMLGCASAPSAPPPGPAAPQPPASAQAGDTTIVAVAAPGQPCCKKMDLIEFLGLPKLFRGVGAIGRRVFSRLGSGLGLTGRFPGLQPKPPVLPITDPANLSADSPPAVKAAAEIKAEEDAAPQKIQALRYLSKIGCGGCYPSVEKALLAALDDCTEKVRYASISALRGSLDKSICCQFCRANDCCSEAVQEKLFKVANDTDDAGCFVEPSDRVRRMARLALMACAGAPITSAGVPEEGPDDEDSEPGEGPSDVAAGPNSSLMRTIQLASHTPQSRDPHDMLLAEVNGKQIFESQVAARVDSRMQEVPDSWSSDQRLTTRRAVMWKELQESINSELILQAVRQQSGDSSGREPTASEIEQWFSVSLAVRRSVTQSEIQDAYQQNLEKYRQESQIRWESVTVPIERFGSREQANIIVEYLRDRILGSEEPAPARFNRQAVIAKSYAWTGIHSIEPAVLSETLAHLPDSTISPVISDSKAFYLVRVLERRPARVFPLAAVADEIRDQILADRRDLAQRQLIGTLRSSSTIWTVFDSSPHQQEAIKTVAQIENRFDVQQGAYPSLTEGQSPRLEIAKWPGSPNPAPATSLRRLPPPVFVR